LASFRPSSSLPFTGPYNILSKKMKGFDKTLNLRKLSCYKRSLDTYEDLNGNLALSSQ
jgi:hypothetical protein